MNDLLLTFPRRAEVRKKSTLREGSEMRLSSGKQHDDDWLDRSVWILGPVRNCRNCTYLRIWLNLTPQQLNAVPFLLSPVVSVTSGTLIT